jgi:endonuclease/exonuclease/phosphatase family metal-dependent hydrolase
MITRRRFLELTGFSATASLIIPLTANSQITETAISERTLRTITYNIRGCYGSSDVDDDPDLVRIARPQMPARIAMELALYEPDIITLQEAPDESFVAQMAEQLNMNYIYFPGGKGIPGALLTRWTILEYQDCPLINYSKRPAELFTRHWGRALLDTSFGKLAVYSAHLWPYEKGNDGREVTEIISVMQTDIRNNQSLIFQGDLNHTPDGDEYIQWKKAGLIDVFATLGTGIPFTSPNSLRHPALKERIDYIWACGPIASMMDQCSVLYERAFRSHHQDPRSFSLSDHLPVMATFIEKDQ